MRHNYELSIHDNKFIECCEFHLFVVTVFEIFCVNSFDQCFSACLFICFCCYWWFIAFVLFCFVLMFQLQKRIEI